MTDALATIETETEIVPADNQTLSTHPGGNLEDFVTFFIGSQMFGIPVLRVQDILTPDQIAPIPLAPKEVVGSINLRGRIVTVIDVRTRLGLPPREKSEKGKTGNMGVTVEQDSDLYTLLVETSSGFRRSSTKRTPPPWIRNGANFPTACTGLKTVCWWSSISTIY